MDEENKTFYAKGADLKISDRKIRMQEARKGIDFLGYFVKPDYTLARRAVVARFKKKLNARYSRETAKESINFESMVSSYFGHFSHANCHTLRRKYAIYLK